MELYDGEFAANIALFAAKVPCLRQRQKHGKTKAVLMIYAGGTITVKLLFADTYKFAAKLCYLRQIISTFNADLGVFSTLRLPL